MCVCVCVFFFTGWGGESVSGFKGFSFSKELQGVLFLCLVFFKGFQGIFYIKV